MTQTVGLNVSKSLYLPSLQILIVFKMDYPEFTRNFCQNPLARHIGLLAPSCQSMEYFEPWTHIIIWWFIIKLAIEYPQQFQLILGCGYSIGLVPLCWNGYILILMQFSSKSKHFCCSVRTDNVNKTKQNHVNILWYISSRPWSMLLPTSQPSTRSHLISHTVYSDGTGF